MQIFFLLLILFFNPLPAEYQIRQELGSGDKGVVYLAQDAMGFNYALKIYRSPQELIDQGLPPEIVPYFFDETGRSRMAEREYELSQILTHPAFVKVYGTSFVEGNSILIMEYVDGKILSEVDSAIRAKAFGTAVKGLLFALERGYVHHDLYDGNAMIDSQGRLKFIDLDSFDKVDEEIEDNSIEECLESYQHFLREFLANDKIYKKYRREIRKRLHENLSPDNLHLIIDYLARISPTSDEA
jgi:serine/threonine protein kinase